MVGIQSCVAIAQIENLVTTRIFLNDISEVIPEDKLALEVSFGTRQLGRKEHRWKKERFYGAWYSESISQCAPKRDENHERTGVGNNEQQIQLQHMVLQAYRKEGIDMHLRQFHWKLLILFLARKAV